MSSENSANDIDARVREAHVPIYFLPGWVRERYLGWSLVHDATGLRVSVIRHGPVTKYLVLARGVPLGEVTGVLDGLRAFGPLSTVSYHDFLAEAGSPPPTMRGHRFRLAKNEERCVNIDTFVFDLATPVDELFKRLQSNARRNIKKAESLGITVRFTRKASHEELSSFFTAYARMAKDKGLQTPSRRVIERMFADGDVVMACCRQSDRQILVSNLTYISGDSAIFLHGASSERSKGEGQLVHWETIKFLKGEGLRWYDLGGIASTDPQDGIFRFKKSMGGAFVPLGREYVWAPRAIRMPIDLFRRARRRLATG